MANLKIEPRIAPSMNLRNSLKQSSYVLHVSRVNVPEASSFDRASRNKHHVSRDIPHRFPFSEDFPEQSLRSIPRHGTADTPARDNPNPEWAVPCLHDERDKETTDDTPSLFVRFYELSSMPET